MRSGCRFVAVESAQIDAATRRVLRSLWDRAFGADRFNDDDADHAFGGVHVLAWDGPQLVGHASAVPRSIGFGQTWRTVGYVEAVAVDPACQREGIGRRMMQELQAQVATRWPVAMLSTGRATRFYEHLGWERWQGLSYTRTDRGIVADDEHGGLMILRPDPAVVPDLAVAVTCVDRPGDAW